jgi:hypothetical protein
VRPPKAPVGKYVVLLPRLESRGGLVVMFAPKAINSPMNTRQIAAMPKGPRWNLDLLSRFKVPDPESCEDENSDPNRKPGIY